MYTFTPEKVRELVCEVVHGNSYTAIDRITKWLEGNQIEPVVVGLSDEQLTQLFNYFPCKATKDEFIEGYQEWSKTQTFTQPEVKEVVVGLSDEQIYQAARRVCELGFDVGRNSINEISLIIAAYLEAETFTQSSPMVVEPVFVGLTDEQVTQFIEKYNIHPLIGVHLKDWQKTQTFTQPEVKEIRVWLKKQTFAQPEVKEVKEVAVGLSDEHIKSLAARFAVMLNIPHLEFIGQYNEWKLSQTFTQPEVKEIPIGLSDSPVARLPGDMMEYGLTNHTIAYQSLCDDTEELRKEKVEVPVGLSHEQIRDLACVVSSVDYDDFHTTRYDVLIQNWLKTQSFEDTYEDKYNDLYEDYQSLLVDKTILENTHPTPSWDSAPDWANWLAQDSNGGWYWHASKPISNSVQWGMSKRNCVPVYMFCENWQPTLQERPKPIQVEVGQVWTGKYSGDFEVIAVNDVQVVRKNKDGGFIVNGMEDFLANFSRKC